MDLDVSQFSVDDIQGSVTESTESLVVSTMLRDGGTVSFQSQISHETFAHAQLARLAYKHNDVTPMDHDEMRRVISFSPYPQRIKVGANSGLFTETASSNDSGIITYELIDGCPEGLMAYKPLLRGDDPLVPLYFCFRGTDNVWDIVRDVSLNTQGSMPYVDTLIGYETQLQVFLNWITTYITTVDKIQSFCLIGHSLGAKYALDVTYELVKENTQTQRLSRCSGFNGFYVVDERFKAMFAMMNNKRGRDSDNSESQRSLLRRVIYSHVVQGDFASRNMIRTPLGNVIVYPTNEEYPSAVLSAAEWESITLAEILINKQHSIDNFVLTDPEVIYLGFEYDEDQEFVISTVHKEYLPNYKGNDGAEHCLNLYAPMSSVTIGDPYARFGNALNVKSDQPESYKWIATTDLQDFQDHTVIYVAGQIYLNVPATISCEGNSYIIRVLPTVTTGEYVIEELYFPQTNDDNVQLAERAWTAPDGLWTERNRILPLQFNVLETYSITEISAHDKYRWKFESP